jgi:hypothetical protein
MKVKFNINSAQERYLITINAEWNLPFLPFKGHKIDVPAFASEFDNNKFNFSWYDFAVDSMLWSNDENGVYLICYLIGSTAKSSREKRICMDYQYDYVDCHTGEEWHYQLGDEMGDFNPRPPFGFGDTSIQTFRVYQESYKGKQSVVEIMSIG